MKRQCRRRSLLAAMFVVGLHATAAAQPTVEGPYELTDNEAPRSALGTRIASNGTDFVAIFRGGLGGDAGEQMFSARFGADGSVSAPTEIGRSDGGWSCLGHGPAGYLAVWTSEDETTAVLLDDDGAPTVGPVTLSAFGYRFCQVASSSTHYLVAGEGAVVLDTDLEVVATYPTLGNEDSVAFGGGRFLVLTGDDLALRAHPIAADGSPGGDSFVVDDAPGGRYYAAHVGLSGDADGFFALYGRAVDGEQELVARHIAPDGTLGDRRVIASVDARTPHFYRPLSSARDGVHRFSLMTMDDAEYVAHLVRLTGGGGDTTFTSHVLERIDREGPSAPLSHGVATSATHVVALTEAVVPLAGGGSYPRLFPMPHGGSPGGWFALGEGKSHQEHATLAWGPTGPVVALVENRAPRTGTRDVLFAPFDPSTSAEGGAVIQPSVGADRVTTSLIFDGSRFVLASSDAEERETTIVALSTAGTPDSAPSVLEGLGTLSRSARTTLLLQSTDTSLTASVLSPDLSLGATTTLTGQRVLRHAASGDRHFVWTTAGVIAIVDDTGSLVAELPPRPPGRFGSHDGRALVLSDDGAVETISADGVVSPVGASDLTGIADVVHDGRSWVAAQLRHVDGAATLRVQRIRDDGSVVEPVASEHPLELDNTSELFGLYANDEGEAWALIRYVVDPVVSRFVAYRIGREPPGPVPDAGPDADTGAGSDADAGADGSADAGPGGGSGGCSCETSDSSPQPSWLALGLVLGCLFARRRVR